MQWTDRIRSHGIALLALFLLSPAALSAERDPRSIRIGDGWAANSVNTTVFRRNSVVSHGKYQFAAYYDPEGYMTLARRRLGSSRWEVKKSPYKGHVRDAHNSISLMIDGAGYLHVSWDHHGNPLRYATSNEPLSLELGALRPMTGEHERSVTYPEFYRLPSGDLLFFYRDGGSGSGNLLMNRYDVRGRKWTQVCANLIDGENLRNAYWQACVDGAGVIHVSWVWRETADVATNHDLCYARSRDGGTTWERSTGEPYRLPIDAARAEYIARIPCRSELINSTSMTTDRRGAPYIASYWRSADSGIPQFHIVYRTDTDWKIVDTGFRRTDFTLQGTGTKRIPVSRPQLIAEGEGDRTVVTLFFRDEERGSRVSAATCRDLQRNRWSIRELTPYPVGSWEPSYDTELWRRRRRVHLFVQHTDQADAEGISRLGPQPVYILEMRH